MPMISLFPTVRRVEVRWFQALSFSTLTWNRAAIFAKVSPERTVYVKDRELEAGTLAEVVRVDVVRVEVDRVLAAVS